MRLLCPNCDAQYEVDDSVIPKDGRDVQCSSCGQTWFQKSAAQLAEAEQTGDTQDTDQHAVHEDTAEQQNPEPEVAHEADPEPENEGEPDVEQDSEPESDPEHEHEQRKPDEAVLDVLRQEAALEVEARHDESQGGLETQPDLGLDQANDDAADLDASVSQRTARLRGIEPEADPNASRGGLLPDIEEINSSLQNESGLEDPDEIAQTKRGRSGFRLGFGLIIILATLLFLAYIYAPQIIAKVPSSEAIMTSYVEAVNGVRQWLDQMMQSATAKMSDGNVGS